LSDSGGSRLLADEAKRELSDTLRRRRVWLASHFSAKRVRGARAKSWARLLWEALEGLNPREHPVAGVLNTCPAARDSWEGKSPETGAGRADLLLRRQVQRAVERYVGSFERRRANTSQEGKAPKGESQERCRGEIKPAGVRREEAVERVTKP
jgi:hypothetical protein